MRVGAFLVLSLLIFGCDEQKETGKKKRVESNESSRRAKAVSSLKHIGKKGRKGQLVQHNDGVVKVRPRNVGSGNLFGRFFPGELGGWNPFGGKKEGGAHSFGPQSFDPSGRGIDYDKRIEASRKLLEEIIGGEDISGKEGPDLCKWLESGLEEKSIAGNVGISSSDVISIPGGSGGEKQSVVALAGNDRVVRYGWLFSEYIAKKNHGYMRMINQLISPPPLKRVVPDSVYLSGGSQLVCNSGSLFTRRLLQARDDYLQEMLSSPRRDVMYQVMDRGGVSLRAWRMVRREFTFAEVLLIGKILIRNLIKLHSYGVIHGDLHWENVLLMAASDDGEINESSTELLLIDFDRSFIMGHKGTETASKRRGFEYLAPNEFAGGDPTMGSDIFRVYEVMKGLMKPRYFDNLASYGKEEVVLERKLKNRLGKEDTAASSSSSSWFRKKFADKLHELVVKGLDGRKFGNLKSIIEHEEKVERLIDEKLRKLQKIN